MSTQENIDAHQILFGLNRAEDERSFGDFLRLFADPRLTTVLIPRLSDEEINSTVEMLSTILRRHLSEKEYHALFLGRPK